MSYESYVSPCSDFFTTNQANLMLWLRGYKLCTVRTTSLIATQSTACHQTIWLAIAYKQGTVHHGLVTQHANYMHMHSMHRMHACIAAYGVFYSFEI